MGGEALALARNARSGKPLSVSLRVNVQTSVKAFVHWLADRPGYKSLISHSIADYFGPSMKDARIARDRRPIPYPSEAQILHAFRLMPHVTDIDRRNRALLALLNLTGARIGAIASLMLGHIDLEDGCVNQDGRSVNTKFGKSFTTWFLPIDPMFIECLSDWINELRDLHLFSATDPLFPRPEMRVSSAKGFQFIGLSRKHYSGDESLRKIVKNAFTAACLPAYTPHRFRNAIIKICYDLCKTPEEFKAMSMGLGHEHVSTTIDDYGSISPERQREVLKKMWNRESRKRSSKSNRQNDEAEPSKKRETESPENVAPNPTEDHQ